MSWVPRPLPAVQVPAPDPAPAADGRRDLVDDFIESYVLWRESCEAVDAAYESWASCAVSRRDVEFETYRAALDWEELAAQVHAGRAALVTAAQG